jgi:hypothetical protein
LVENAAAHVFLVKPQEILLPISFANPSSHLMSSLLLFFWQNYVKYGCPCFQAKL